MKYQSAAYNFYVVTCQSNDFHTYIVQLVQHVTRVVQSNYYPPNRITLDD